MRLLSGIIILTSLLVTSVAYSQTRKDVYELQGRCGKSAAETFEKDFPKEDRKGLETYENHYNVRLNKCFILEENTLMTPGKGNKVYKEKLLTLADVQDNKIYGSFSSLNCDVQETKCHSEQEFRALVRSYMEN
jgi:hypothetical protein